MASTAKKSLALDPLENNIDVKRTSRSGTADASNGRRAGLKGAPREGPESAPKRKLRLMIECLRRKAKAPESLVVCASVNTDIISSCASSMAAAR